MTIILPPICARTPTRDVPCNLFNIQSWMDASLGECMCVWLGLLGFGLGITGCAWIVVRLVACVHLLIEVSNPNTESNPNTTYQPYLLTVTTVAFAPRSKVELQDAVIRWEGCVIGWPTRKIICSEWIPRNIINKLKVIYFVNGSFRYCVVTRIYVSIDFPSDHFLSVRREIYRNIYFPSDHF